MVTVNTEFVQGGYGIVLENIDQTLKALKNAAPDLDKELKKQLKTIGNEIVTGAKQRVPSESPLSNWAYEPKGTPGWREKWKADERGLRNRDGGFPRFNSGQIQKGIKTQVGKPKGAKFGAIVYVVNKDAAGSIFEVAGRRSEGRPGTGGPNFINVLNDYDKASRVIWDAYDALGRNAVNERIIQAVDDAETELRRRFGDDGFTEQRR